MANSPTRFPGWSIVVKLGLIIVEKAELLNPATAISAGIIKDQELIKEKLQPHSMHAIMDVAVSATDAMSNAAKHIEFIAYQLIKDYFKKWF